MNNAKKEHDAIEAETAKIQKQYKEIEAQIRKDMNILKKSGESLKDASPTTFDQRLSPSLDRLNTSRPPSNAGNYKSLFI